MRRDDTDERDTDPALPVYTPFDNWEDATYAHLLLGLHQRVQHGEAGVHVPQAIAYWYYENRLVFGRSTLWGAEMRHFVADYSSEPPREELL